MRRRRETFRDLDIIATATDAQALIDAFTELRLGRRRRREGRDEGDGGLERGLPLRPARRAAGVLRQPAPALHRLEGPQRRAARGGAAPRASRSPSTASPRSRRGEVHTFARRGGAVRVPRLPVHPARAARERRRARGGAAAASCRSSSRRGDLRGDLHCAHDLVGGRQEHDRGDGARARRRAATRTSPITDHSHYLRDGRLERAGEGDRRAERAAEAVPAPARGRGEHPRERHARRRRRDARRARLGGRVDPRRAFDRTRPSASSPRWRTRTSTASAI